MGVLYFYLLTLEALVQKTPRFEKGSTAVMIFQLPPCLQERKSCLPLWSEASTLIGPHFTMQYRGAWLKDQLQSRAL